jgi:hypothetical protein
VKKLSLLLATLLVAGLSFGQAVDKAAITDDNLSVVPIQNNMKVGPNKVEVVARHCAAYAKTEHTFLWFGKKTVIDSAACAADPSTVYFREVNFNLKTTGGIDVIAKQLADTAAQPASGNYIALSTDAGAPAAGDCAAGSAACTLTGEISTNGLARAQAVFAHTNGTSTYTLSKTWTATGTHTNVQKAGVFNAASSGTMIFENTFTATTLNNTDQIQLTWTITIT